MSHDGMDDSGHHGQGGGMDNMVPPTGGQPMDDDANDMRGRAAENEQETGTEAVHGGGHGADDPAGDDNGVDPAV